MESDYSTTLCHHSVPTNNNAIQHFTQHREPKQCKSVIWARYVLLYWFIITCNCFYFLSGYLKEAKEKIQASPHHCPVVAVITITSLLPLLCCCHPPTSTPIVSLSSLLCPHHSCHPPCKPVACRHGGMHWGCHGISPLIVLLCS